MERGEKKIGVERFAEPGLGRNEEVKKLILARRC